MPKLPPTKSGEPSSTALSAAARHLVLPSGIVSTGWPAVRDKCATFGVAFDPWQDGAGRVILSKRADGSYACSIGGVVLSIPRQVGKTFLIGAIVFALCLLNPGLTVLWTAHRLRTANETFAKMQAFARKKLVKPNVDKVVLGAGEGAIVFHNRSRILFGARERGFGRGFDDVDVEVFDEAQILSENAVDDMIPAMNTAANPLPIFIGTPPKPTDPSEIFTMKRKDALAGDADDGAYIEFSADEDAKPDDRSQWAIANPSYPQRTPDSAMLRMKKNLGAESFVREALGIWDSPTGAGYITGWDALTDRDSVIASHKCWALSVSPIELGPQWTTIGVAGRREDGRLHVAWLESRSGTAWIVDTVEDLYGLSPLPIRIHKSGPEGSFIDPLRERGVDVVEVSSAEVASATGQFIDAANAGALRHLGQASLDIALKGAVLRTSTDGAALWSQRNSQVEITALMACTVAAGGVPVPDNVFFVY